MGVFDRLRRLFRSNVNDLINRAEDPEKALNQIVSDMSKQLVDAKRSVATAIAEEKRLERQVKAQDESAAEWERRAIVALQAGKEDLAREALLRKQREQNHADALRKQFEQQHQAVQSLKDTLRTLQDRIEEAQRKKSLLVARAKRAEAQKRIQEVLGGLSDTSALDAFDEMAARVEQLEAQTEALGELQIDSTDKSLEDQIAALEQPDGDKLLNDLRERLTLEGSGTGGGTASQSGDYSIDEDLDALKRRLREAGGR